MALQQELEGLAFALGGRDYFAPVQTVGDFLKGRSGSTDFLDEADVRAGCQGSRPAPPLAGLHHEDAYRRPAVL